jgi:hypothetical protein
MRTGNKAVKRKIQTRTGGNYNKSRKKLQRKAHVEEL